MSHFYGTVGGGRGVATRCGHRGLTTHAASHKGAVKVSLWHSDDGNDCYTVCLVPWKGVGPSKVIASGVLGDTDTTPYVKD